jgi:hypothetical protein
MTSLSCTEFFNWDVRGMPVVDSDVLWTPSWPRDVSGTKASLGCATFCKVPCVCNDQFFFDVVMIEENKTTYNKYDFFSLYV